MYVVFSTQLQGQPISTKQKNDAAVCQLLREHYVILVEVVRKHDGTIVKTRCDGVHVAFLTPDAALLT